MDSHDGPKATSPDSSGSPIFLKRPMLEVPTSAGSGPQLTIMTYNMLAQGLIKRDRFPGSGSALRWKQRSAALAAEIASYNPDVLCLQEVDVNTWSSFWKKTFQGLGYVTEFHSGLGKAHGVAIACKSAKFQIAHHATTDYDKEETEGVDRITGTGNVALAAFLTFAPDFAAEFPTLSKDGIIVATTHLYWHPDACFERSRQTYILLRAIGEFQRNMRLLYGADKQFYTFFGADLNSQPFDTPYLSITSKPVRYSDSGVQTLTASLNHDWTKTTPPVKLSEKEITDKIKRLEALHNGLGSRAVSLYSLAYHMVHPENAGLDNERNEPLFSNWAHVWTGLLDYICVVCDWDSTDKRAVDDVEAFAQESCVRLVSLLRMPTEAEMGEPPCGQPRPGEYPSDHLCMIAVVELL